MGHYDWAGPGPKGPVRAQTAPSVCAPEAHIPAVCTRTYVGLTKLSPGEFGQTLCPMP
jgi:hypothetical protein